MADGGLLGASVVAGGFALYLREQSRRNQPIVRRGHLGELWQWFNHSYFAMALGAGSAVYVWRDRYLMNESWGDSGFQFVELFGACMVAVMGLSVVGAMADDKRPAGGSTGPAAENAGLANRCDRRAPDPCATR